MKTRLVFIPALLLLSGCATSNLSKLDAKIPDGNWEEAKVEVHGKFTSTTLNASGVKQDGKWVEGELHFDHSNPWVQKASVDLKVSKP